MSNPLTLEELQQEAIAFRRAFDAVMLSTAVHASHHKINRTSPLPPGEGVSGADLFILFCANRFSVQGKLICPLFNKFQKVIGSHQWLVIHKPEAGCVQFLNDLGLVAAHVSHNPVRADTRVATKVDNNDATIVAQRLV